MTDDAYDDDELHFGIPHPILSHPAEYRITELHYTVSDHHTEPFLDLHLSNGRVTRKLRFLSPQKLVIEEGFPNPTGGMMIVDTSYDGLEGLGVRVIDIEATPGSITFYARTVVDVDAS